MGGSRARARPGCGGRPLGGRQALAASPTNTLACALPSSNFPEQQQVVDESTGGSSPAPTYPASSGRLHHHRSPPTTWTRQGRRRIKNERGGGSLHGCQARSIPKSRQAHAGNESKRQAHAHASYVLTPLLHDGSAC